MWAETTCKNQFPAFSAAFSAEFCHFFLAMKNFLGVNKPPETRRRTHKKNFDRASYTTFEHPRIILGWSDEPFFFGGGGARLKLFCILALILAVLFVGSKKAKYKKNNPKSFIVGLLLLMNFEKTMPKNWLGFTVYLKSLL